MNESQDPATAETVQTTSVPAVDLPRLVRRWRSEARRLKLEADEHRLKYGAGNDIYQMKMATAATLLECAKDLSPNVLFGRILFIYAKEGQVKCYSAEEIRPIESEVKSEGWHHTATIDPARWIEAMANGSADPSDIVDEIQFKPNA